MGVRGFFGKIIVIALTFCVSYFINFYLIFSHNQNVWGTYTTVIVTTIAFIVAAATAFAGRKKV